MSEQLGFLVMTVLLQLFCLLALHHEEIVLNDRRGLVKLSEGLLCELFAKILWGLNWCDVERLFRLLKRKGGLSLVGAFEGFSDLFFLLLPFFMCKAHC